jgi:hypothetical protein
MNVLALTHVSAMSWPIYLLVALLIALVVAEVISRHRSAQDRR